MSDHNLIRNIKNIIESSNINFLIGSGISHPFLEILNTIEDDLTTAEDDNNEDRVAELKKEYFEKCMLGNLEIVDEVDNETKDQVLNNYQSFYKAINYLLLKREDTILTKQVNIFTTNIDIFSEKALEESEIEFNDGFSGRFNPRYNAINFKKSYFKKSSHFENTSEIPIFNILKLHGSLSWKQGNENILLDKELTHIRDVQEQIEDDILEEEQDAFFEKYSKLMIINPTKQKFEDTVLKRLYYDLFRIYSNELEKENSILFVMGFSFADEHIQSLTLQVVNSNPTLIVYIFSHSSTENEIFELMKNSAKNKNIKILYPINEETKYDLETITQQYFLKMIDNNEVIEDINNTTNEQ